MTPDEFSIIREDTAKMEARLMAGITGVHERLDDLNGRTRTAENAIAVLEDRAEDEKVKRWLDRGIGALVAGLLGYVQFRK